MYEGRYFCPFVSGVKEGSGIAPNVYVYDNPNAPGARALKVAERTVAAEIR